MYIVAAQNYLNVAAEVVLHVDPLPQGWTVFIPHPPEPPDPGFLPPVRMSPSARKA